jgi:hypothetical protein
MAECTADRFVARLAEHVTPEEQDAAADCLTTSSS